MRTIFILLTTFFLSFTSLQAQGIEFFHGTWEEALLKAKAEDRIIFVDAFTTWCGPCKAMAANTFPNPEVGEFFNKHFISMKIDMEKEMGLEFRKKFPVTAYPTLFFIDYDQEVILKSVGGKTPPDLISIAETVVAKFDKSSKYEGAYAAGDRSYQLVYDYVAALNKSGKPSLKVANEYLASQTDLTTPENLKFILEAAAQVDCKCFELLEQYKTEITKLTSNEAVNAKIRQACENTVKRAIEYESPDLIELAAGTMKRHGISDADYFESKSHIQYALALHDLHNMETLVNQHVKKFVKNDGEGLHQLALDLDKYGADNQACRDLAISLAGKAAKEEDPKYVSTYAKLKHKAGARAEAIMILDEAIRKSADPESKEVKEMIALKTKIENS